MNSTPRFAPAQLDRKVTRFGVDNPPVSRMSALRNSPRIVLMGEPGMGKSTALEQAANFSETQVVKARFFVEGDRPPGRTVFIDSLEEYCIGEPRKDRFNDVVKAIRTSSYSGWFIACRSISLPPDMQNILADRAGTFDIWQLAPLDHDEAGAVLQSLGDDDPADFIRKIVSIGAEALLGNPASVRLLWETKLRTPVRVETRGALFHHAVNQMTREHNQDLISDLSRPTSDRIVEAAEKANLVMLLASRDDLWAYPSAPPPTPEVVTIEDLLPAIIDTKALLSALDTPIFRGEAGAYQPSHRVISEYLAGRALAHAVAPKDPREPALSLDRAIAFINGDGKNPAPALTGLHAWFVTELSKTVHASRAMELMLASPESVLFHGDAANLPTAFRLALLTHVGRLDPWFLRAAGGSTAIGGLAGNDVASELAQIIASRDETLHRRVLVLRALASGPRVTGILRLLYETTIDSTEDEWLRRESSNAYINQSEDRNVARLMLLGDLSSEAPQTGVVLRLELITSLIGHESLDLAVIRQAFLDYAGTREGVMGYLYPVADALVRTPLRRLFNKPLAGLHRNGGARYFECESSLSRILSAAIRHFPDIGGARLLAWIRNCGFLENDTLDDEVREAVASWLELSPQRSQEIFSLIKRRSWPDGYGLLEMRYRNLTGKEIPRLIRENVIDGLRGIADLTAHNDELWLAQALTYPWSEWSDLYWRLWYVLVDKPGAQEAFSSLTVSKVDNPWATHRRKLKEAERVRADRNHETAEWFNQNREDLRSGNALGGLIWASDVFFGFRPSSDSKQRGWGAVCEVLGEANAHAVAEGWNTVTLNFPISIGEQGRNIGTGVYPPAGRVVLAFACKALSEGRVPILPAEAAFALLTAYQVPPQEHDRGRLAESAIESLVRVTGSERLILDYWIGALAGTPHNIPGLRDLVSVLIGREALKELLKSSPSLPESLLREALLEASSVMSVKELACLVEIALSSSLACEARILWVTLAFHLDPVCFGSNFISEVSSAPSYEFIEDGFGAALRKFIVLDSQAAVYRDTILICTLGPLTPPINGISQHGQIVPEAIATLACAPTKEATVALAGLVVNTELAAWNELLRNRAASQLLLRREAEFKAPQPADVSSALQSGPPATAADLRAIVKEVILELKHDIRNGDTSPWRSFWNRPSSQGSLPTAKIENECRDHLTDRLRDRLLRFNIPAHRSLPESQSKEGRRVDLLILGEGDAALPLEAKRQNNPEIWTAPKDQLLEYAKTANSGDHGIYLVFWFGLGLEFPRLPNERGAVQSADELESALKTYLSDIEYSRLEIIVLDVSDPKFLRERKQRKTRSKVNKPKR